jgi:hypothetical protein
LVADEDAPITDKTANAVEAVALVVVVDAAEDAAPAETEPITKEATAIANKDAPVIEEMVGAVEEAKAAPEVPTVAEHTQSESAKPFAVQIIEESSKMLRMSKLFLSGQSHLGSLRILLSDSGEKDPG